VAQSVQHRLLPPTRPQRRQVASDRDSRKGSALSCSCPEGVLREIGGRRKRSRGWHGTKFRNAKGTEQSGDRHRNSFFDFCLSPNHLRLLRPLSVPEFCAVPSAAPFYSHTSCR